jgi:hypothetical protein
VVQAVQDSVSASHGIQPAWSTYSRKVRWSKPPRYLRLRVAAQVYRLPLVQRAPPAVEQPCIRNLGGAHSDAPPNYVRLNSIQLICWSHG